MCPFLLSPYELQELQRLERSYNSGCLIGRPRICDSLRDPSRQRPVVEGRLVCTVSGRCHRFTLRRGSTASLHRQADQYEEHLLHEALLAPYGFISYRQARLELVLLQQDVAGIGAIPNWHKRYVDSWMSLEFSLEI